MEIQLLEPQHSERWDAYVVAHPHALSPHLWGMSEILGPGLLHSAYRLGAIQHGALVGVLPLIHLRRPLLGNLLVSLPFVNDGGILADSTLAQEKLLAEAIALARRLDVTRLELRHRTLEQASLPYASARVGMVLTLPEHVEDLRRSWGSKLRNQVKKAQREGVEITRTGLQGLDAFYKVFATHMRELGSPVWPRYLFWRILRAFPDRARLYLAHHQGQTVGGSLVFRFQQGLEIPWASALKSSHAVCANVGMYAQILEDAVKEGYQTFDFGRSPKEGGTHRFKAQWGAKEIPLYWHTWSPRPMQTDETLNTHRTWLVEHWRRLPLGLTKVLGPPLRRLLPQ